MNDDVKIFTQESSDEKKSCRKDNSFYKNFQYFQERNYVQPGLMVVRTDKLCCDGWNMWIL